MRYDLIIKNGTIVTPEKSFPGDIAVCDGIISKTGSLDDSDTADVIYDAAGKHILSGIIDAHVHFRDPGLTEKEDFESGSMAAAFGGITTAADMPNVIPVTSTVERFNQKVKSAREKSYIDFALFALLNNDNFQEMEGLKKAGALGFKVFLGTSTGDIAPPSPAVLMQQLEESSCLGMRTGFHCETSEINEHYTSMFKNVEANERETGLLLSGARPVFSEALSIQTSICYAKYTNARIHIHHITSADGALLAAEAKQKGINLTAETCPHYLIFDGQNAVHKVYPPIRDESHRITLWDAIRNGAIDMIASDHAPHTALEKALPVWKAPAGLCGVETLVPLFLNEVNKGTLTLNDFVRLASEAPAKTWGIYPQKGNLLPGADADFTIVDMSRTEIISANDLHSKSKTSPYDGMELKGMPAATIVRGVFVMKDGILTGRKGYGNLISPV
ncbi:MAG: dihydroorotase family protein [Treponema sp.]|nr:dihydroorotase family protein [Treponema sp.]